MGDSDCVGFAHSLRRVHYANHHYIDASGLRRAARSPCCWECSVIIGVLNEALPGETRVAATPATVEKLIELGYGVVIEPGAGAASSAALRL
jgi:hypothetical protein